MTSDRPIENPLNGVTSSQRIISSCTGAILTSLFVTPLDVVKTRLQVQEKHLLKNKCYLYCNGLMDHICICSNGGSGTLNQWSNGNGLRFNGTLDAFMKISRTEGISSLWSGLPPTLVMAVPATVVYFTSYDQLKYSLSKQFKIDHHSYWIPVVAGAFARGIAVSLISPLEFVRTKLQAEKLSYFEIHKAVKNLVQQRGVLSLWRGLGPTLLRDVPFSSLYWTGYEYLKYAFDQTQPDFWFSFVAGGTSGTISAIITLPFDVIKTHRQIELGEKIMYSENPKRLTSTYALLINLYQKRGVSGLFAGIVPRVVKVAPACAIMISMYEGGKSFFRKWNYENDSLS